jgi:hypothetical protein
MLAGLGGRSAIVWNAASLLLSWESEETELTRKQAHGTPESVSGPFPLWGTHVASDAFEVRHDPR